MIEPAGWRTQSLGEFVTLERGFDLPSQARRPGTVPIFAAGGRIGFHDNAKVEGPGVVIGRSGTLGRAVLIPDRFWPLNTTFYVKDFHGNDPEFVCHFLTFLRLEQLATGTGVKTLNRQVAHARQIVVPPLAEQVRIVAALKSSDAAVAAQQDVFDQACRMARHREIGLLRHGIGPRRVDRVAASRGAQVDASRGRASWPLLSLGELCTLEHGHAFKSSDWALAGLPIIRIGNLRGSPQFKYFAGRLDPAWLVEPGDLLFAWAGVKGKSIGPYLWPGPCGVLNQHIFKVRPAPGIERRWLFAILTQVAEELDTYGFNDSLQHVRKGDLLATEIAVPPPRDQREFVRRLESFAAVKSAERATLEFLHRIQAGMQHDLLSGRIRVDRSLHQQHT